MEQTQNLWTIIEEHRRARPTSNISVDDAERELKHGATEIQYTHRIALQWRVFRFHLQNGIASVCSFSWFNGNSQRSGYQTAECDEV